MDLDDVPWPATLCGVVTTIACFAWIFCGSIVAWNRSGSPDDVCGNPGIGFFLMGLVGGVVGGVVVGTLVTKLVSSLMDGPAGEDSHDAIFWEDDVPSAKVIANEAKRKSLRAEIGQVERMIRQAENQGDEEVSVKLVKYRERLTQDLGVL
jgi:hypothetical protein